jgi:ABC-type transport system involved in multi-copper enzyme maturation permease subunit
VTTYLRSLASEFAKVFRTRLWWLLAIILVAYVGTAAGGIALAFAFAPEAMTGAGAGLPIGDSLAPLVYSMATASGFVFPVILGAISVTSEVRHRTLTTTFTAIPKRSIVLAGKATVGLVLGAVLGVLGFATSVGAGALSLGLGDIDTRLGDSDIWAMVARGILAMALWGFVGVGLGVMVPSQIGSIVSIIAFTQFIEPLVRLAGTLIEPLGDVVKFLPGAAGDALVGSSFYTLMGGGGPSLEWWQGALLLAGYGLLFLLIGRFTFWRRDVT